MCMNLVRKPVNDGSGIYLFNSERKINLPQIIDYTRFLLSLLLSSRHCAESSQKI